MFGKCWFAVLAILLAGCGGSPCTPETLSTEGTPSSGRQDVSYGSSEDIRKALATAGLACDPYEEITEWEYRRTLGLLNAVQYPADCVVQRATMIGLAVWEDNGQRDTYISFMKGECAETKVHYHST